jgi:hypothetical protein
MYIQGVSTRKVKTISEQLCGHSFSASAISEINKKLDNEPGRFARRELESGAAREPEAVKEELTVLISKKLENEEWWTRRQSPMRSRCFFLPPHSVDRCGIFLARF